MTEVQAWIARLDQLPPTRLAGLREHLDPAEHERARRLRREEDRDRFTATRGLLRELLGAELNRAPAEVVLATSDTGKPKVAAATDLRFNASHSGGRCAFALARGREVGIDVERDRARTDIESLAPRVLSAPELAAWRSLGPGARRDAFFRAWVRKEAYAKGLGLGLRLELHRVTLAAPGAHGHLPVVDPPRPVWAVSDLDAGPGYAAAVAAEGEDWEVALRPLSTCDQDPPAP